MTRPIVWALGVLGSACLTAVVGGHYLAGRAGPEPSLYRAEAGPGRVVTLQADWQGHFFAHPLVGGRRTRMLVDTGATAVALSYDDAAAAGFRLGPRDFTQKIATANGVVSAAPIRIPELRIGDIVVRNVEAVVAPQGGLSTSLLGMSFLRRLGGFEFARGRLTLRA